MPINWQQQKSYHAVDLHNWKTSEQLRISEDDIGKIIQSLDPNKAHGHNQIIVFEC